MNRKPIFDAVRKMLPLGFTQDQVDALDRAIDEALGAAPAPAEVINDAGLALIKEFEGTKLTAYPDPATGGEPWTIGTGATYYEDGTRVRKGDTITAAQADELLRFHIKTYADEVRKLTNGKATPNQHAAMTSLAFNVGVGNFGKSTLLRKHNAGDFTGAAAEFARWNKANGKVMAGLTRRRTAEAALYRRAR